MYAGVAAMEMQACGTCKIYMLQGKDMRAECEKCVGYLTPEELAMLKGEGANGEAKQDSMFSAVDRVSEFSDMPTCAVLGSYGGGDAFQMARQVFTLELPATSAPSSVRDRLPGCIEAALAEQKALPDSEKVAKLPESFTSLDDSEWDFTVHFQISSRVYGEKKLNLFNHAWLFCDIAEDKESRGATSYPLVGLFEPIDGLDSDSMDHDDVAYIGVEKLKWAEEHIHKVEDGVMPLSFLPWHYGTDMARFHLEKRHQICSFWGVTVDVEECRADFTFFLIVRGSLEDKIEQMLREHTPHNGDQEKVRRFAEDFMNSFTAEELTAPQRETVASLLLAK